MHVEERRRLKHYATHQSFCFLFNCFSFFVLELKSGRENEQKAALSDKKISLCRICQVPAITGCNYLTVLADVKDFAINFNLFVEGLLNNKK